ncbi:hypothetical protein AB0C27_22090 [Nonomuraea sp. NPDC048882]|uniref:hypothetical protein n=1 Tax=Nonomuraea sp. NPDC048882 TaxID=3154347 RepID=UPI0034068AD5
MEHLHPRAARFAPWVAAHLRRFHWSIRARMTMLAAVVALVLCVITSTLILNHRYDETTVRRLARLYAANLELVHRFAHRPVPEVIDLENVPAMQLVDRAGQVVSATPRMRGQPRMATFVPPRRSSATDRRLCDVPGFPHRCVLIAAMWVPAASGDLIAYSALPAPPGYVSCAPRSPAPGCVWRRR